jgi:hypothetical protein
MAHFIKRITVRDFRNKLHFEFFTSMAVLLNKLGVSISSIVALLLRLDASMTEENTALQQVRRYDTTEQIQENDRLRDSLFYGIRESIHTAGRHFDAGKREAAHRIDLIFENYGKTPKLSLPEESAAIHSLLQQLETVHDDTDLLGLADWLRELNNANDNVRNLTALRESEAALRALHRMKTARAEVDRVYAEIVDRLEAAATLEGPEAYATLFGEINARVDEYKILLAKEKGRRNKGKDENGNENGEDAGDTPA